MRPESDFQDGARWRRSAEPRHPALVGLLLVLVAAAAGVLLLRYLGPPGADSPESTEVAVAPAPTPQSGPAERRDARADAWEALKVSPFRRSHPWAAPSGGRYYYRSSCPEALSHEDLEFFRSEREARAAGLKHSATPGC